MEKVAIIGMGTSGMAVAAGIAKVMPEGIRVDCYDTKESFGKGYPYRDDTDTLLLNLKTRKISYDYENNDDLADWHKETGRTPDEYTARAVFGEYTSDRLDETLKKLDANRIYDKIVRLDPLPDNRWELETEDGTVTSYDRVHLCSGELANADPCGLNGCKNYVENPYPADTQLAHLPKDETVLVIGAGLTGVDVATVLLLDQGHTDVRMYSRTNVIPTVRVDPVDVEIKILTMDAIDEKIKAGHGLIAFSDFEELLLGQLNELGIDYDAFVKKHMKGGLEGLRTNIEEPDDLAIVQALLPPLNLVFNKVWVSMTKTDRRKLRTKYHPFLCLNRSPLPQISAEQLIAAAEKGKFSMPEDIHTVRCAEDGDFVALNADGDELFRAKAVVNATGLDMRLDRVAEKNDLIAQLLNKRILQKDEYAGITVLPDDVSVLSPRLGHLQTLHAHGVLVAGVQYRNNSTLIIQRTAHELAKQLYG